MRYKIRVTGIDEIERKLGVRAASSLKDAIDTDLGVETRKTAMDAADRAPVETGALQASIRFSTRRDGEMKYHFGSYMPYALRQEYEHKSKSPFLRRAYWNSHPRIAKTIKATIIKRLKG